MKNSQAALVLCLVLALAGCGQAKGDWVVFRIWGLLNEPTKSAGASPDISVLRAALTPDVLAQVGGPVLIIKVPSMQSATFMTPVVGNPDIETFLSGGRASVSLRDGMIVGTRGFGFDLMTAEVREALRALSGHEPTAMRTHQYLDGEDQLVSRSFDCTYARNGRQVRETCAAPSHEFENRYVVDDQGRIVSSRQWISPQVGYILSERVE